MSQPRNAAPMDASRPDSGLDSAHVKDKVMGAKQSQSKGSGPDNDRTNRTKTRQLVITKNEDKRVVDINNVKQSLIRTNQDSMDSSHNKNHSEGDQRHGRNSIFLLLQVHCIHGTMTDVSIECPSYD